MGFGFTPETDHDLISVSTRASVSESDSRARASVSDRDYASTSARARARVRAGASVNATSYPDYASTTKYSDTTSARARAGNSGVVMVEVGVGVTPMDLGGVSEDDLWDTRLNNHNSFHSHISPLNNSTNTKASSFNNSTGTQASHDSSSFSSFQRIAELEHHVQGLEASLLQVTPLPLAH